jgi:hypothetical protein
MHHSLPGFDMTLAPASDIAGEDRAQFIQLTLEYDPSHHLIEKKASP